MKQIRGVRPSFLLHFERHVLDQRVAFFHFHTPNAHFYLRKTAETATPILLELNGPSVSELARKFQLYHILANLSSDFLYFFVFFSIP